MNVNDLISGDPWKPLQIEGGWPNDEELSGRDSFVGWLVLYPV